jgi:hydrogenase large subunit
VKGARKFVEQVYIPDVLAIAPLYKEWFSRGEGLGNFLSYGDYSSGNEKDPNTFLFPRGAVFGRDLSTVHPVDPAKVTEFVSHSWYEYSSGDNDGKHPYQGETNPKYTGPKPPYDHLDVDKKYSWLKAPRYDGKPMEVGPLARMVVGYAAGQKDIRELVDGVLKKLNAPPTVLFSTLGRIAARALESLLMARKLETWVEELDSNLAHGKVQIFNPIRWDPGTWPSSSTGFGWHEAPRGSLGHWVDINGKSIKNYQAVVPTTWNAGPRDAQSQRGAYEASLLTTPVADPARPLEILRTIHSFDPCLACAVHVIDAKGRDYSLPRAV